MQDDREEFEANEILRDRELTPDEVQWMRDQNDKPVEVRVLAPARLGDRLRAYIDLHQGPLGPWDVPEFLSIADAIDQDAGEERLRLLNLCATEEAARATGLRQRIEEAVERLRYPVAQPQAPHPYRDPSGTPLTRDVLDVEPFLAELDRIFGERAEASEEQLRDQHLRAIREEQDFLLEHGVIHAYPATSLPSEHEPAAERRERQAAKFEDREGRVEGVDR